MYRVAEERHVGRVERRRLVAVPARGRRIRVALVVRARSCRATRTRRRLLGESVLAQVLHFRRRRGRRRVVRARCR